MSKKPTSIRDAKKIAKKMNPEVKTEQKASSRAKEITLHQAYEIIGGYTNTVSPNVYERAFKMVMEVDPDFAKTLRSLYNNGTSFKRATSEQIATAEEVVQNAKSIDEAFKDDSLYKTVIEDEEIDEAINNTPIVDEEVSKEEQSRAVFATAEQEVIVEIAEDIEYNKAKKEEKREMLVSRLKNSIKRTLFTSRRNSLGHSIENIKDALNFKKKVSISSSSIKEAYNNAYAATSKFISGLAKKGFAKAAPFLNKVKTSVHSGMTKALAATMLVTSFLPSCGNAPRTQDSQQVDSVAVETPAPQTEEKTDSTTINFQDVVLTDTTAVKDSIVLATEWNDSLGISNSAWVSTHKFLGDNYEAFGQKISDDMLEKSGFENREQFLNAYRALRSFYPEVTEKYGEVIRDRSLTSEKFSQFFHNDEDCVTEADFTKEDFEVLKLAPTLEGNLNRRADHETPGLNPCDPGNVHIVNGASKQKKKPVVAQEETNTPSFTFVEEGSSTIQNDSVPSYSFSETGSTRVQTVVEGTDSVSVSMEKLKGNSLNDGQVISSANPGDVVSQSASNVKKVLVENNGSAQSDSVKVDTAATVSPVQFAFNETGSARIDSTETASPTTFTFNESGSARVDSTATVSVSTQTLASNVVNNNDTDAAQVVEDSEDLPKGTPAAGNVPERGGYENSGLISARQDANLKKWYQDKYGENAYEDVMAKITDDMLAKGGAFEGLSQRQALRVAEGIMVHANLFPESAAALEAFFNPCKDAKLTAEQAEQIRQDGYQINEEGVLAGKTYNKGVYARYYVTGDCEEDGHVNYAKTRTGTHVGSDQYYGRFYLFKPIKAEPIYTFEHETGVSRVVTENVASETLTPTVQKYKGNDLNIEDSRFMGDVDAQDVINQEVSNRTNVLVEQTGEQTSETVRRPNRGTGTSAKKQSARKAKRAQLKLDEEKKAQAKALLEKWAAKVKG